MSDIYIQWLDSSGWSTTETVENGTKMNGYLITSIMKEVQGRFPDKRIRAVDSDGRIVDILS